MAALVKMWVPDRERFEATNVGGSPERARRRARGRRALVYTSSFIAVGPTGAGPPTRRGPRRPCASATTTSAPRRWPTRPRARPRPSGDDVVMLYPGVVYGPGDMTDGNLVVQMIADHLNGRLPGAHRPGDRLWSYAFVEDVAEGHVLALERGGRASATSWAART